MFKTKELWVVSYLYTLNILPDRVEYHGTSSRVFFVYENLSENVGVSVEAALYSGDPRLVVHLPTLVRGFNLCRKWLRLSQIWRRSFSLKEVDENIEKMAMRRHSDQNAPKDLNELMELLEIGGENEDGETGY